MNYKKLLPVLDRYLTWATPTHAFMLALAAVVCIVSLTFFEHRTSVTDLVFKNKDNTTAELNIILTPEIKQKIQDLTNSSPEINLIAVVSANIRINQRETVYYFTDDQVVDRKIKAFNVDHGLPQPIFSADEPTNAQMVSVINGEFGCYKYEDTPHVLAPSLKDKVFAVCRTSLPPYYGEFSGYITIGLMKWPDDALQNEIRIQAVRLATEIYFKSIKQ
jgi:hypothetical protein